MKHFVVKETTPKCAKSSRLERALGWVPGVFRIQAALGRRVIRTHVGMGVTLPRSPESPWHPQRGVMTLGRVAPSLHFPRSGTQTTC